MISNEWIELEPPVGGFKSSAPVSLALIKDHGGRARGRLCFSSDIAKLIGGQGRKVRVQLGTGENRHCLMVLSDPDGGFELRQVVSHKRQRKATGRFTLSLPKIDQFPDIRSPSEPVLHRFENVGAKRALIIDLPRMCWSSEHKAREEEKYLKRVQK